MEQETMENAYRLTICERSNSHQMFLKHYPIDYREMCQYMGLKENDLLPLIAGQIGLQQIGKSTFANMFFGTEFQTGSMKSQTTLGLNIKNGTLVSDSQKTHLLVSDNEGFDSCEDGENSDHISINNSTILMAYSDIIFYHMNAQEISLQKNYKYLASFIAKYINFFSENKETANFRIKPLTVIVCIRDAKSILFSEDNQSKQEKNKTEEKFNQIFKQLIEKMKIDQDLRKNSLGKFDEFQKIIDFQFMYVEKLTKRFKGQFQSDKEINLLEKNRVSQIIQKVKKQVLTSNRKTIGNCFQAVNTLIYTLNKSENKNLSFQEILQQCALNQIENKLNQHKQQAVQELLQMSIEMNQQFSQQELCGHNFSLFKTNYQKFKTKNLLKIQSFTKECENFIEKIIDQFQVQISQKICSNIGTILYKRLVSLKQEQLTREIDYQSKFFKIISEENEISKVKLKKNQDKKQLEINLQKIKNDQDKKHQEEIEKIKIQNRIYLEQREKKQQIENQRQLALSEQKKRDQDRKIEYEKLRIKEEERQLEEEQRQSKNELIAKIGISALEVLFEIFSKK